MTVLFLFIPLVLAKHEMPHAPGMYPPEEMKNDVPTMPRNPYQTNMVQDDGAFENYQFYYEKDPSETKSPGKGGDSYEPAKPGGKPSSHIVPSGGPIPPPPPSNIHRPAIPMYINVSPKSPAPPLGNETPRINRPMPIDDTPMTKRPSHGDDSDRAYQPESYYETAGPPKGPVPPHSSTTPETSEYIGWTPLPKNKYALSKYDDKSPPARPATSDYIRAPGIPNDEEQQNEVLDPYITPKTPKYENALARNKPSPTEELNTSGAYGRAGPKNPGTHQVWKSNEVKQTSGMDDPPREEQDSSDKESTGSYERKKDRQHLNVGRPTSPGITPGLGAETNPYLPGTETFTSRNAMAGGRSSGTAEVVGKKELPTISISMSNKPSQSQWLPDESWKTSTKYESVLKSKGPRTDDMDILKVNAKCCPCCREPHGSTLSLAKRGKADGSEQPMHSGGHVPSHSGTSNAFIAQQREAGPVHPNRNFVDDLEKLSDLGDTLEQHQPNVNLNRVTTAARQTDLSGSIPGISSANSIRVEPEQITSSADIIPRSHGTIDTLALQRSVSPFSSLPGTSSGQYATPWNPGASASFPPPQPLMPLAPQPYSPVASYAPPGGGCPCAPPRPAPCCAPVQPCCLRKLPMNDRNWGKMREILQNSISVA
ncbi:hypothetical protein Y032_0501g2588 [Ancylostoma ceylanicum]|uniref:Uncharacterized protein n=1 Tax=Ancylostoma ceylanicum TaxID=53326 RepID=A0A016WU11_9BILA|nr:hypothetical protein Y032_0501g2588 [Ancylostoma ceylanicum]